eukprot:132250_1
MADDFFRQKYKTQRVNRDVSQDLAALETPVLQEEKKDYFALDPSQKSNPFKTQIIDEEDNTGGYTIDDLLNGYVIDEETISAIDECLVHISTEWDWTQIVTKDLTDCERLIVKKCNIAHSTIISSIIDPPNVLYDTLLRLARKMKAISLVLGNQKMIYVPQNIEELAEIGAEMHGINSIITIKYNTKMHHAEVVAPTMDDYEGNTIDDNDDESIGDASSHVPAASQDLYGGDVRQSLESMIFSGRQLYKDTTVCKRLEKNYVDAKNHKKGLLSKDKTKPN